MSADMKAKTAEASALRKQLSALQEEVEYHIAPLKFSNPLLTWRAASNLTLFPNTFWAWEDAKFLSSECHMSQAVLVLHRHVRIKIHDGFEQVHFNLPVYSRYIW